MWLNEEKITDVAISSYRRSLTTSYPNHIVIDHLFDQAKLDGVLRILQEPYSWQTQKHTYSALYVDNEEWQKTSADQRFVQRDAWQRNGTKTSISIAHEFLTFLRSDTFMHLLSRIFNVQITDANVAAPEINTNYFRLGAADFVEQHADDSPGREVCMLLYLNKAWKKNAGGELTFIGKDNKPVRIAPIHNRCVLFDPSSEGSEHWVNRLNVKNDNEYRFNVTSWYWSE
ncbi:Uncharacterised protein [BD1-7 clade bacterium]|uniref:Prolyl 4-hydroxylase alpha subunit Fe(2+) 2OG dioxygenase domain-containing protein n=1 Tax=BD1-7 clade bacterium TaxID=2029982 RepID=A0A5S9QJA9_9GAMM|nr:Uncharacterised protein [BD1-7 clade bacterium]